MNGTHPEQASAYQPTQQHQVRFDEQDIQPDAFAASPSKPVKPYQAQNELDRLRLGDEFGSGGAPLGGGVSGGLTVAAPSSSYAQGNGFGAQPISLAGWGGAANEYSTTTEPSVAAQTAYEALQSSSGNATGGILQSRHASNFQAPPSNGSPSRNQAGYEDYTPPPQQKSQQQAGQSYTKVNGDPSTHTVTLSTTTYQPNGGGNVVEAVDTYTYRRPETTNGEYGNFPRRGHSEHVVGGSPSTFANGGKVVKSGDKVVPLGGPGSAEERPGLARHGGIVV
ncbi:hypothetical protein HKX48_007712 [Thoreauomyces humboldtii]|nr:hypothetical protein HKX48_007712 [Thoreauomyces humboldtii]